MRQTARLVMVMIALSVSGAVAADWPWVYGPRRDSTSDQKGLLRTWPAEGPKPEKFAEVEVHYEGRLIDGTVFDSSYQRGEPISFLLSQVIAGWQEGVQLMSVGSKYELTIPPQLGYGAAGIPGVIPKNAPLVFTVELLRIW